MRGGSLEFSETLLDAIKSKAPFSTEISAPDCGSQQLMFLSAKYFVSISKATGIDFSSCIEKSPLW